MRNVIQLMKNTKNVEIISKENKEIKVQVVSGSNKTVSIPLSITEDLSYIIAAIMCDGHLRKNMFRIVFEVTDNKLMEKFISKFNKTFKTKEKYRERNDKRLNRKNLFRTQINSKPIVVFLNEVFNIPKGRKSSKIVIPCQIKSSDQKIKEAFLEGVIDTDGGDRGKYIGITSKSERFIDELIVMSDELNLNVFKDKWYNKEYDRDYYGLKFKRLRGYPSGQRG